MEDIKIDQNLKQGHTVVEITLRDNQFSETAILLEALRLIQIELIRHEYRRNF
jgi:hypothetical protein